MWFVLHLPVSCNVPVDNDEAELFICISWYWYRHKTAHKTLLPALFAEATQSQDFLVQYNHVQLS